MRARSLITTLAGLALVAYTLRSLTGWLPSSRMPIFLGLVVAVLAQIAVVAMLVVSLVRNVDGSRRAVPVAITVAIVLLAWLAPALPSRPEMRFRMHRAEYEQAAAAWLANPDTRATIPAVLGEVLPGDGALEFVIDDDFYLPLVFVVDDRPERLHDSCAHGGAVVQRIAPRWYVCQRDPN